MPIKCESCRHYSQPYPGSTYCDNPQIFKPVHTVPLDMAREICDREGDGHFVYFEPRTPTAGAAFASGISTSSPPSTSTPTTPEMAMKAAA